MGHFYSPFLVKTNPIKINPPICTKCGGALNTFSVRNRQSRQWTCNFCNNSNQITSEIGNNAVEEYIENSVGDNGIFFIIDLCIT